MKDLLVLPLLLLVSVIFALQLATPAYAANDQLQIEPATMKFLAAGIAFALGSLASGFAVARVGAAGLAASAERPEIRTVAIILTALGEALAIYSLVIAILILGQEA